MISEKLISLKEFFELRQIYPLLDARSEAEFEKSHIPKAINIPLLNDAERKTVGTIFKHQGSERAVEKGFELVGPRFHSIIKEAKKTFPGKKIITYCWRGGMRSMIISWLLSMAGFEIFRLEGGYKTYRKFTYQYIRRPLNLLVLGGKTGCGKTLLLQELEKNGEAVLNLENLANHKGSAFGGIAMGIQPSVEQFENYIAEKLLTLDESQVIWLENESRRIGKVQLPIELYEQLISAPMIEIEKSWEDRIQQIKQEYAHLPKNDLIAAVQRLSKRLGGLRTHEAIEAIKHSDHETWIESMLVYYDKTYSYDLHKNPRKKVDLISLDKLSIEVACQVLINNQTQNI